MRAKIEAETSKWPVKAHFVEGTDRYAAMRRARAALAASGTVTLELALAGTPAAVAYKIDAVAAPFIRRMIKSKSVVLTNLVLGENAVPEFLQQDCTAEKLAAAISALLDETPERAAQLAALARVPAKLALADGSPSEAAAEAVLAVVNGVRPGGSDTKIARP